MNHLKVGILVAATIAMAPFAHGLVAGRGMSCPLAAPGAVNAAHASAVASQLDPRQGPVSLPAPFGVALLETTRDTWLKTASTQGWQCGAAEASDDPSLVRCESREHRELVVRFDEHGTATTVDWVQTGMGIEDALATLTRLQREQQNAYPAYAPTTWGEASPAFLTRPLRQFGVRFAFANLVIEITATSFGTEGVTLRQQYKALAPRPRTAQLTAQGRGR